MAKQEETSESMQTISYTAIPCPSPPPQKMDVYTLKNNLHYLIKENK